jgi:hypothetical protein
MECSKTIIAIGAKFLHGHFIHSKIGAQKYKKEGK